MSKESKYNSVEKENKEPGISNLLKLSKTDYPILKNINLNESETNPTKANEYITKGRKTLFNPSSIYLLSPKKENPNRNKRNILFKSSIKNEFQNLELEEKKQTFNNDFNFDILSDLTFGDASGNSSKINSEGLFTKKSSISNNQRYKYLVKKIAISLKKRVNLPKCKIFKFHYSYRMLILRIAKGIKKTAKKLNFWKKWEKNKYKTNKKRNINSTSKKIQGKENDFKSQITVNLSGKKSMNNNIKINLPLFKKSKESEELNSLVYNNKMNDNEEDYSEMNKNLTFLKNLDSSIDNDSFINIFSDFLHKNNIEIDLDTKLPIFKDNNNKYLLSKIEFWLKYIDFIFINNKNNLTINKFVNFIEQFYIWIDKKNNINFKIFNDKIIKQINSLFNPNIINDFLLIYKLNNLEDLFKRYKFVYINQNKEIKINEMCECPLCKAHYKEKVINYNKKNNQISFSKENNLSYNINNKNIEENSQKKFSKNKTVLNNDSLIEFSIISNNKKNKNNNNNDSNKVKNQEMKSENNYHDKSVLDYFTSSEKKNEKEIKNSRSSENKKSKSKSKNKNKKKSYNNK